MQMMQFPPPQHAQWTDYEAAVNYSSSSGDWKYSMRREIQEIIPSLFVGPYSCARDKDYLISNHISHLLCVMDHTEKGMMKIKFPQDFIYHDIEVTDSHLQNLIPFFPNATQFIGSALAAGGRVLVYCNNGISRSPSFVIAYLMESLGWDFQQAFTFVQNKRFCMNPLEGFKIQLREYEPIFHARMDMYAGQNGASVENVPTSVEPPTARRRRRDEDEVDEEDFDEESMGTHSDSRGADTTITASSWVNVAHQRPLAVRRI